LYLNVAGDQPKTVVVFVMKGDLSQLVDTARAYEPDTAFLEWFLQWLPRWRLDVMGPLIGGVIQRRVLIPGSLNVIDGLAGRHMGHSVCLLGRSVWLTIGQRLRQTMA
jgi:hypothetical protein